MKNDFELKIGKNYRLTLLDNVRKDDIKQLFINKKTIYLCNYPEKKWYDFNNFKRTRNYSIEKKKKFFQLLGEGAVLLSPTQDSTINKPTKTIYNNNVIHFGSPFTKRLAQLHMSLKVMRWLHKNRKNFDNILCYNFAPFDMLSVLFAKVFLRKKIIVDFEDDYLTVSRKKYYKLLFNLIKRIPDEVICINGNMTKYFNCKTYVFNGFIDLSYMKKVNFRLEDNMTFLFSGTLDDIRGFDLLPDIVKALKKRIKDFKILITGDGPLVKKIDDWNIKEINYLGFLSKDEYYKTIKTTSACLVLQKPDHPFNKGSYPSKIELYSEYKKPILKLFLND